MGKYDEKHSSEWVGPFLPDVRITEVENKETGEKGKGYGWTRDEANRDAFQTLKSADKDDRDYTPGSSGSGGSGGGGSSCCYITTACLDAMGLPQDSLEMKAIKALTKEHILKSFQGKKDYILYGRKAPAIVQAIDARNDSCEIWKRVYSSLRNITNIVFSGNYQKGHQQYKDLVLGLENEFVKPC